jgi:DNA-binding CsgD family transcriptional regulator
VNQLLPDAVWRELSAIHHLSPRETQIVHLVVCNENEKTIAELLQISPHTVHSHLERIYRKLEVRSRSEVVARLFATYVARYGPVIEAAGRDSDPAAEPLPVPVD